MSKTVLVTGAHANGRATVLLPVGGDFTGVTSPLEFVSLDEVEPRLAANGPEGRRLYGDAYRTMTAGSPKEERSGSSADVVARAAQHALTARKPRSRYPVGGKSRLMSSLGRVLPQYTLDALRLRALGLPRESPIT